MSYNPVRAANPYRNNNKRRNRYDPHAGTKHSDIMRRQGVGQTIPLNGRTSTPYGLTAPLFQGDTFTVRTEYIQAGSALGYGVNKKADRIYQVTNGVLFVTMNDGKERTIFEVQAGGVFRASKGCEYSIATSTQDVELLVVEDTGYENDWVIIGDAPVVSAAVLPPPSAVTPDAPTPRRRKEQNKAKQFAEAQAASHTRKASTATSPNQGKIGRSKQVGTNSANVAGVNPMPSGAGGFNDD